jgi:hypothetical protein
VKLYRWSICSTNECSTLYKSEESESLLVGFIVCHGMLFGMIDSIIGHNVLYCSSHYNISIDRISKLEFRPNSIDEYVCTSYDSSYTADLLSELLPC